MTLTSWWCPGCWPSQVHSSPTTMSARFSISFCFLDQQPFLTCCWPLFKMFQMIWWASLLQLRYTAFSGTAWWTSIQIIGQTYSSHLYNWLQKTNSGQFLICKMDLQAGFVQYRDIDSRCRLWKGLRSPFIFINVTMMFLVQNKFV